MISRYQEDITQLLVLEVGLHLAESLFRMICGLEKFIGGVGVHSGEGAQSQPVETIGEGEKKRCGVIRKSICIAITDASVHSVMNVHIC